MPESFREPNPRRLYRDKEKGVFCGVCAGLADYFGFALGPTRVLTVVFALFFFPITVIIYIGLCFILPAKPQSLYKDQQEAQFWHAVRRSPTETFDDIRHLFREMEAKLQRMERYVTSPRFSLDSEFRDLESDKPS